METDPYATVSRTAYIGRALNLNGIYRYAVYKIWTPFY